MTRQAVGVGAARVRPSGDRGDAPPEERRHTVSSVFIASAMVVVTLFMFTGLPLIALRIGSLVSPGLQPHINAWGFLVVFAAGVALCYTALGMLQDRHTDITGGGQSHPRRGWEKAQCDDRVGPPATLLDAVLTCCVVAALVALIVCYFGYPDAFKALVAYG